MSNNTLNYFSQPSTDGDNTLNIGGTWTIGGTAVTATASQLNNLEGGDAATGITAFAGGGQASATALTAEFNNVTTVATAYDSVKLPTASSGARYVVKNSGANILSVFPNTSDSINALAVNLSIDIPVGGEITFRGISDTVWETIESLYLSAPTTQRGGLAIKAANNASNVDVTLINASHGQATTITIPDGGAAASFVAQSTAALSLAEVDVLDGATAGTQVASKAVIADANVNTGVSKVTQLHIGASGSETQVTATAAEINLQCDGSAQLETIDSGAAVSVTLRLTHIDNTTSGAGAITLAAPHFTMYGVVKTIEMTVDNGDVTLSLANVQGQSSGTTATFNDVGDTLVLVGGVSKWTVIGEAGITLS